MLEAEELIIDQEFKDDDRTMNFHFKFDYEKIRKYEEMRLDMPSEIVTA